MHHWWSIDRLYFKFTVRAISTWKTTCYCLFLCTPPGPNLSLYQNNVTKAIQWPDSFDGETFFLLLMSAPPWQEAEQAAKRIFNIQSQICFVPGYSVYGLNLWPTLTDQAKEDAKSNKTMQFQVLVATIVK